MKILVKSLITMGIEYNIRVLKLLLEQKLECDKIFKEVVQLKRRVSMILTYTS